MSDYTNKSKKAFKWDLTGRIAQQGFVFITSVFLARILTPEEFGLIAMVNAIIIFAQIFIDLGFSASLVQKKDVSALHYGSVFWVNITIGIFLTIITFSSARVIANFYGEEQLYNITQILSINFLINAFGHISFTKNIKELNFNKNIIAQITASFIGGTLAIFLAFNGFGVWSLVYQSITYSSIRVILLIIISKHERTIKFSFAALKDLLGFSSKIFFTKLLERIFLHIDAVVIGKILNSATLGYYNRAKGLKDLIVQNISGSMSSVMMPLLSKLQDDNKEFLRTAGKSLNLISFITFFVLGLFFVLSQDLIIFIYGDQWYESIPIFKLILLSGFAFPLNVVFNNMLIAKGKAKGYMIIELIKKTLLTINLFVGFHFGLYGFLYGLIIIAFIDIIISLIYVSNTLKIKHRWFLRRMFSYAILSVLIVLIISKINLSFSSLLLNLSFYSFLFTFVYMVIARICNLEGLKILLSEIKKLFESKQKTET